MGIIISNVSIAIFSAGTVIGACTAYFITRLRIKGPEKSNVEVKSEIINKREDYKLIMAIRNDLKMQKGKVAAQCGHAAVAAYAKASIEKPKTLNHWWRTGCAKIALKVESEEELLKIDACAKENDVLSSIVRDAGQTQVAPGSRTVIAIGPAPKSKLDKITGHLKLY